MSSAVDRAWLTSIKEHKAPVRRSVLKRLALICIVPWFTVIVVCGKVVESKSNVLITQKQRIHKQHMLINTIQTFQCAHLSKHTKKNISICNLDLTTENK